MNSSASSGTDGGSGGLQPGPSEEPRGIGDTPIHVVVEIPKGSRNKYELDHETGRIRLDRMLFSPVHYPTDYGFVPGSLAEDGDPLDALVLLGEPTFPGCEIQARIVGMLDMADDKGPDQKLLVVPLTDPQWNHIYRFEEVAPHLLREIEHFFTVYKQLEDKTVEVYGWRDASTGHRVLREALTRGEEHRRAGHGGSTVGA
jgi:inorganic pyrophosphatase